MCILNNRYGSIISNRTVTITGIIVTAILESITNIWIIQVKSGFNNLGVTHPTISLVSITVYFLKVVQWLGS